MGRFITQDSNSQSRLCPKHRLATQYSCSLLSGQKGGDFSTACTSTSQNVSQIAASNRGRVARPIARRRAGPLTFFHHKRPVSTITDIQPLVGDNGDRPVSQGQGAPVHQDGPRSCSGPIVALFENLRRLAGVSEAGARCRNPERSQGSPNDERASARCRNPAPRKNPAKSLRNKYSTSKSFKPKDLAGISS